MSAGVVAGGAAAAAALQAEVATGMVVRVEPDEFARLVARQTEPFVVRAKHRILTFDRGWRYLTPYRGLVFYTQSPTPLYFPPTTEFIEAQQIWVP